MSTSANLQVLEKYNYLSDEYPVHLTELALNPSCELPVRILAATKLKDYVKVHWNPMARDFKAPEMNRRNKKRIKELLPTGLSESDCKVRETVADIIAIVARWEWPENWSEILDILNNYLHGDNDFGFIGAMLVLDSLTDSLPDAAVPIDPLLILPVIIRIFEYVDQYSAEVICLAVSIFSNIAYDTARLGSTDFIQRHLQPAILLLFEALITTWKSQDSSSSLKLKSIRCVSCLVEILPRCVADPLPELFPMVLETFADCAKKYRDGTMDRDSQDLAEDLFAFINSLMFGTEEVVPEIPEFQLLDDERFNLINSFGTLELLQHVFIFMEITEEDIQLWNNDVKQFVSEFFQMDELGMPIVDGSRRSAEDVFMKVAEHPRLPLRDVLIDMIIKPLDPENAVRAASDPITRVNQNWWKEQEAQLLALCLMKDNIMERLESETLCFDIMAFLNNVVLAHLNDSGSHPLLVARCFHLCGLYAAEMSMEMMTQCLEATMKGLRTDQPATVRVAAAQAVYRWFDHYAAMERRSGNELMVCSRIPALFEGLYSVAEDFRYGDIRAFVLKGIASMMPYDEPFTASEASRVFPLMAKALLHFSRNYEHSQGLIPLEQFMGNPGCMQSMQESLIPTLVCMMATKPKDLSPGKVIRDVIEILVRRSPLPLSDLLIKTLFPAVCEYIVGTDDSWNRKYALSVFRAYLSSAPQQLIDLQDKDGKNGVQHILRAIVHVLNLDVEREVIMETYETVIVLLKQVGSELEENVGELLKALLNTIQHIKNFPLIRCKFFVACAYLLNAEFDTVFNYLAIKRSPYGQQDPFESVIYEGFCKEYNSFDEEDRDAIKLALGRIRVHGFPIFVLSKGQDSKRVMYFL